MLVLRPVVPVKPVRRRVQIAPRADMNEAIYLTGKFLGSFVLFTSTLNWWHYKRTRENLDPKNSKDEE